MSEAYDVPLEVSANCVVVMGRRGGEERTAACLVRADTRADVNSVVKRLLDVRKCSFLDHDRAVAETGMEHPLALPFNSAGDVTTAYNQAYRSLGGEWFEGDTATPLKVPNATARPLPKITRPEERLI